MGTEQIAFLHQVAARALPALADAAVKGAMLLVLAGVALRLMRRAPAAARHLVWVLAMGGLVVLPVLSAALPGWGVLPEWVRLDVRAEAPETPPPVPPVRTAEPVPDAPPADFASPPISLPAGIAEPPAVDGSAAAPILPAVEQPAPAEPAAGKSLAGAILPWVPVVWAAGTLLCLLPLLLGRLSLWRLGRSARAVGGPLAELTERARAAVGLKRPVVLLVSDRRAMPMIWGVLRPRLLLPAAAADWPAERLWVVLLHELGHARRLDCLAKLVGNVACAAYWFNPLVWLAQRAMQAEAERACDDLVLAAGRDATGLAETTPADYAEHILNIASGLEVGPFAAHAGIALARPSKLERRIRAILDSRRSRHALTRWGILLAVVLAGALAMPISMMKGTAADGQDNRKAPPGTAPAARSLEELWQALSGGSYDEAHAAARQMAARGDAAVAFLDQRLPPAASSPDGIARLVAELDSEKYQTREAATRALAMLGGAAREALQRAAKDAAGAETRQRASTLLAVLDDPTAKDNAVLAWAVGVLEAVDTSKSAALLDRLSKGPKDSWLTRRAAAARRRLAEAGRMLAKAEPAILQMRGMPAAPNAAPWIRPQTVPQALAALAKNGPKVDLGAHRMFRWFECDSPLPAEAIVGTHRGKSYVLLWDRAARVPDKVLSRSEPWEMARVEAVKDADGMPAVEFELGKHAAGHVRGSGIGSDSGKLVALMVGERIVSVAPRDADRLSPRGTLNGLMSPREARAIVKRLRAGMTPLCRLAETIEAGEIETVRRILDEHPGIERARSDVRGLYGRTPLHVAVRWKRWEIAQLLIDRGADVNAVGLEQGRTALHSAASSGNVEGVRFLIKHGADLKAVAKNGFTPLHDAICEGLHADAAAALLDAGADVNSTGKAGITPLTLAVIVTGWAREAEKIDAGKRCIDLLVSRGAKLDVYSAAALGRTDELKALLAADPKAATATASMSKLSPLAVAAFMGQLRTTKMLLAAGADATVNTEAEGIGSPLTAAAGRGHAEVVKLLLAAKADPSAVNSGGDIPIHAAAWSGSTETIEVFLSAGVPASAPGKNGKTALHVAAGKGWKDAVSLLLARGADPRATAKYRGTPLHAVCSGVLGATAGNLESGQDYPACAKALLAAGADVNARAPDGRTPLHRACGGRPSARPSPRLQVVRALLAAGADVNAVVNVKSSGERGKTPIHFAAETADAELIKTLLDAGADPFVEPGGSISQMAVQIAAGTVRVGGQEAYELLKAATEKREQAALRQVEAAAAAFFKAVTEGDDKAALALTIDGLQVWSHEKWPARIKRIRTRFAQDPQLLRAILAAKVRPNWAEVRTAVPPQPPRPGQPVKQHCAVFILMRMPDGTWRVAEFRVPAHGAREKLGVYLRNLDIHGRGLRERVFKDAKATPQPAWGKSNGGVQARLRRDKRVWAAGQVPTFRADIRNAGKGTYSVAQAQQLCELDLNGTRYRWVGEISVKSSAFPPGRVYKDIPVALTENWQTKQGNKALRLKPGRHTLRVVFFCDGGSSHENLVVETNAVEFEVAGPAGPAPPARPAGTQIHAQDIEALRGAKGQKRGKAGEALLELATDGRLTRGEALRIYDILHLRLRQVVAAKRAGDVPPPVYAAEYRLMWQLVVKDLIPPQAQRQLLTLLDPVQCQYYPPRAQTPARFRMRGDMMMPPAGIIAHRVARTSAVDGQATDVGLMQIFVTEKHANSAGTDWGPLSHPTMPSVANTSISMEIVTTWHLVPLEVTKPLPALADSPDELARVRRALESPAARKLCSYRQPCELAKATAWTAWAMLTAVPVIEPVAPSAGPPGAPLRTRVVTGASFDSFVTEFVTTDMWARTISISGDGAYTFEMRRTGSAEDSSLPARYVARSRLSGKELTGLANLLDETKWLATPGKVQQGLKDGTKYVMRVVRNGQQAETACYGEDQDVNYGLLIRLLNEINRQECRLFELKQGWRVAGTTLEAMNSELRVLLNEVPGQHAGTLLGFGRFLDAVQGLTKGGTPAQRQLAAAVAERIRKFAALVPPRPARAIVKGPFVLDKPLDAKAKLMHPPVPPGRKEAFEVMSAGTLTFTRKDGLLQGKLAVGYSSWPKATFVATLTLLDAGGKVLASDKGSVEASGAPAARAGLHQKELVFPLGQAKDLTAAARWRLTLAIGASAHVPPAATQAATQPAPETVTRVYDIRDLIVPIVDQAAPPPWRSADEKQPSPEELAKADETRRKELTERVIELVKSTISPDSWSPQSKVGSIRELNGQIVVTQTPTAHKELGQLLTRSRMDRGLQVHVGATFLHLPPERAAEVRQWMAKELKPPPPPGKSGEFILPPDGAEALIKQVGAYAGSSVLFLPRLTVFSGQQADVVVGKNRTLSLPAADQPGKEDMVFREGHVIDFRATVSADRKHVTLKLKPMVTRLVPGGDGPVFGQASKDITVSVPDGQALLLPLTVQWLKATGVKTARGPDGTEIRQVVTAPADQPAETDQVYLLVAPRIHGRPDPEMERFPAEEPAPSTSSVPSTQPAADAGTDQSLWIALAPSEPTVKSLKELRLLAAARNLNQEAVRKGEWEIRTADSARRVGRLPYPWPVPPDQLLADGKRVSGGTDRNASFRLDESQLRRVGPMEAGDYLLTWYVADRRCSNVMPFRIDAAHDGAHLPLLELAEVEPAPGQQGLPVLVLRARRHKAGDPAPLASEVAHATLNVDGQDRTLSAFGWTGWDGPLAVGGHYDYLLDLKWWTWDPSAKREAPPLVPGTQYTVFAKVGRENVQRTPAIRISYGRPLGAAWDAATAKLPPVPPVEEAISLAGTVLDLQGKAGANYEVSLVDKDGGVFREKADASGRYRFLRIPPGTYKLGCNPPAMGQPALAISGVVIEAGRGARRDISLTGRFILTGRILDGAGKPVANMTVDLRCEDRQAGAEFMDTTQTDQQGRYRLASPLGTVTYIGVDGTRIVGDMPRLTEGGNRVDFVADGNRFLYREERMGSLIVQVGRSAEVGPSIYILKLRHAKVEEVVRALREAMKDVPSLAVTADPNVNAVIVRALPQDMAKIRALIEGLDAPPGTQPAAGDSDSSGNIPARWEGKVVRPDGKPAEGAQVVLASVVDKVNIQDGKIVRGTSRPLNSTTTDAGGRFTLKGPAKGHTIVVTHSTGWAEALPEEVGKGGAISLRPWGRVEGRLLLGDRPGADWLIWVQGHGPARTDRTAIECSRSEAKTDAEGKYAVDHVLPGKGVIQVVGKTQDGAASIMGTAASIEVAAGKTATVTLGGMGRPVVGKLVGKDDIDWSQFRLRLVLEAPHLGFPGDEQLWAAQGKFMDGPHKKLYARDHIPIQADGSFRIENVPQGTFQLIVFGRNLVASKALESGLLGASRARKFIVDPMPGGRSDQPLDLTKPVATAPAARGPSPQATQPAGGAAEIERLIEQLGSDKFAEREAAKKALAEIGQPAVAALKQAARDPDRERAARIAQALKDIEDRQWGTFVEGVRARLWSDKLVWQADQIPALRVDLRNEGEREFLSIVESQQNCQLEVDGQWYQWPRSLTGGRCAPLGVGHSISDTLITLSAIWQEATEDDMIWRRGTKPPFVPEGRRHLAFKPGRHSIRVGFTLEPTRVETGDGFRVISNTVELEIVPAAVASPSVWPASGELTDAVVALHRADNLMINAVLYRKADKHAPAMAEALKAAESVERLSARTPLLPLASRCKEALLKFQEAVSNNQPAREAHAPVGKALYQLMSTLTGQAEGAPASAPPATQRATQPAANSAHLTGLQEQVAESLRSPTWRQANHKEVRRQLDEFGQAWLATAQAKGNPPDSIAPLYLGRYFEDDGRSRLRLEVSADDHGRILTAIEGHTPVPAIAEASALRFLTGDVVYATRTRGENATATLEQLALTHREDGQYECARKTLRRETPQPAVRDASPPSTQPAGGVRASGRSGPDGATDEAGKLVRALRERMASSDPNVRAGLLDELVIIEKETDIEVSSFRYDLAESDYGAILRRALPGLTTGLADVALRRRVARKVCFIASKCALTGLEPALAELLKDPDVWVRSHAIRTAKLLDARTLAPLIAASLKEPALAVEAAPLLVKFRSPLVKDYLIQQLRSGPKASRCFYVRDLAVIDATDAVEHIVPVLRDPDENLRVWAVQALGQLEATGSRDAIYQAMVNGKPPLEVEPDVVAVLLRLGDRRAAPAALAQLKSPDLSVRDRLADRLARWRARDVVPVLLGLLNDPAVAGGDVGTDGNVRANAIGLLVRLKAREAAPSLRRILNGKSKFLACAAARALGELQGAEATGDLLRMLGSSDYPTWTAAASALARFGKIETAAAVVARLKRTDSHSHRVETLIDLALGMHPDLRRRLEETQFSLRNGLTLDAFGDALARQIGMPVVISAKAKQGMEPARVAPLSGSARSALKRLIGALNSRAHGCSMFFDGEPETIRVVTNEEAFDLWDAYLGGTRKATERTGVDPTRPRFESPHRPPLRQAQGQARSRGGK